jgi:glycerol-3-phosphate cytidylyltransferase
MKVGFTCGVFDLFHAGHILMLQECKANCDYLIVALNRAENLPAEKNIPIFSIEQRVLIMQQCKLVDEVLTYNSEQELEELLKKLKPAVRFLGTDYTDKHITGREYSKEIHYTNRSHGLSTSGYIKQILERYKTNLI